MLHQYKLNGYNIVLDTCSGSVHAVDEVAYDIISLFEEKSKEEIIVIQLASITNRYGRIGMIPPQRRNQRHPPWPAPRRSKP